MGHFNKTTPEDEYLAILFRYQVKYYMDNLTRLDWPYPLTTTGRVYNTQFLEFLLL